MHVMLTKDEEKLLSNPADGFPMLQAASAAWKRCGTCGAKTLKVNALLRVAVLRYRLRPEFIKLCASLFKLPVTIAGVVIR
jgi:hypothetical protein